MALHTIILGLLLNWSENLWLTCLLLFHPTASSNDLITEHTGQCLAVTSRRKFKVLYYNSVLLAIFVFWKLVLHYSCCFCLRKVSFLSHRHFQSFDRFSHQLAWKNHWWVFMVEPGSMFTVYGSWWMVSLNLFGSLETRLKIEDIHSFELVWLHEVIFLFLPINSVYFSTRK